MERPQDINSFRATRKEKRDANAVRIVAIFHLVGLIGLSITVARPLFLHLVPFHLLLMTLVVFYSHDRFDTKFIFFFALVFITGFTVEWLGVHTGQLFGNYAYGKTLGFAVNGVPLIMGANWFLLIYSTGVSLKQLRIKSAWLRVLTGALLLVMLDLLIEPVAGRLNYWQWADNSTHIQNYACWFIISLVLLFVFEKFRFNKQNMVGPAILASQFIFFALMQ
ncbi:carotenoid biosynthesis protein [Mucilaginibacter sp. UR6-11]|uniref:carotenoid biosynthesis protein n=1 Tax=Mucilaginibacter sp. UR6-11 TaxID=1435644 RepID=UPI001E37BCCE|nr:carotenoid biosynthesis protein [Mucilaginibacter sp. UR6-11]MCC8425435.1 carotenoid biosynthesis protein [Mucilaginibacter sp. UR6-11]